jgi:hypothetical protein
MPTDHWNSCCLTADTKEFMNTACHNQLGRYLVSWQRRTNELTMTLNRKWSIVRSTASHISLLLAISGGNWRAEYSSFTSRCARVHTAIAKLAA